MTTKHHIIIGLAIGIAVGYFAGATLVQYPVYSNVATFASGLAA